MSLGVREPAEFARQVEEHPQLPQAACERVTGYGVMGLPFRSGHVLGLRPGLHAPRDRLTDRSCSDNDNDFQALSERSLLHCVSS
jgi:hypothetical protein